MRSTESLNSPRSSQVRDSADALCSQKISSGQQEQQQQQQKKHNLHKQHIHTASFLGKAPEGFIRVKISIKTPKFPMDFSL